MGNEQNPAMPTARQASLQLRLRPHNRAQDEIVLLDQIADLPLAPPPRRKLEVLLDFYCKKARLSLIILMCLYMPSSYPIGTQCVEREDEGFFSDATFLAKSTLPLASTRVPSIMACDSFGQFI